MTSTFRAYSFVGCGFGRAVAVLDLDLFISILILIRLRSDLNWGMADRCVPTA
jgi:hypothetical protein